MSRDRELDEVLGLTMMIESELTDSRTGNHTQARPDPCDRARSKCSRISKGFRSAEPIKYKQGTFMASASSCMNSTELGLARKAMQNAKTREGSKRAKSCATIAARSGDPFAVQRLLGHADLQMATRYVQDVSAQTDRVIENSRKHVI